MVGSNEDEDEDAEDDPWGVNDDEDADDEDADDDDFHDPDQEDSW